MKCIKLIFQNNLVVRTTNEVAKELIASGKATYSSKGAWKRSGREYLPVRS